MSKETFKDVHRGERLSAREYNKLTNAVEEVQASGPPAGQQGMDVGGVRGQAQNPHGEILMVRILGTIVPQSSTLFSEAAAYIAAGENPASEGFNAVIQVWDSDNRRWADSPDQDGAEVVVMDDQTGWLPVVAEDIIPVVWKKNLGAFAPLERRESAIVMITGPVDSDGYYPAVTVVFDSETATWSSRVQCYLIDIGS